MDQKNLHKIPSVSSRNDLNSPLPRFLRGKRLPKGGTLFASLWQREVGRDFLKFFQTAKVLQLAVF